ncbi:MAG: FAD-dependent oxidoreductase [Coriobacteriia bacterium]|nr:FAD-dependent oxidoreductase [Coriobacteriia bacterium]
MSKNSCDIAIIGAGPAGLAAGLYAARGLVDTVIFERQATGGQIVTTSWVENYPAFPGGVSGSDLGELMTRQAQEYGARIELFVTVTSLTRGSDGAFTLQTDSGDSWQARAVILACGAVPRKLDIDGEAQYTGRGVSWCATCDANFFRDKRVAVIGGGNTALEEALYLTKFASTVYVVHRREEFRAAAIVVKRAAENPQVEFVLSSIPLAIVGDDSKVTGLRVRSLADEREQTLAVDGVFEFVGVEPVNELLAGLADATDAQGYITADACGSIPGVPGLFAAGDLTCSSLKQVISAAGSGATAAATALKYLES